MDRLPWSETSSRPLPSFQLPSTQRVSVRLMTIMGWGRGSTIVADSKGSLDVPTLEAGKLLEIDQSLVPSYGDPAWQNRSPLLPSAQRVFQRFMERKISHVRLSWWNAAGDTSDRDYSEMPSSLIDAFEPVQALRCPGLLSAIWLQLFLMVVGVVPAKFCENPMCQTPFPATRKDSVYCSDDACRSNPGIIAETQSRPLGRREATILLVFRAARLTSKGLQEEVGL
jgi:hypothetical protein